jgi:hypothetical protein
VAFVVPLFVVAIPSLTDLLAKICNDCVWLISRFGYGVVFCGNITRYSFYRWHTDTWVDARSLEKRKEDKSKLLKRVRECGARDLFCFAVLCGTIIIAVAFVIWNCIVLPFHTYWPGGTEYGALIAVAVVATLALAAVVECCDPRDGHSHGGGRSRLVILVVVAFAAVATADCGDPGRVQVADMFGSTVFGGEGGKTVECNNGYELFGSGSMQCLASGEWESAPVCEPAPALAPTPTLAPASTPTLRSKLKVDDADATTYPPTTDPGPSIATAGNFNPMFGPARGVLGGLSVPRRFPSQI